MAEAEITSLAMASYNGQPLSNTFFRQPGQAPALAILFPGLNYSVDMPLLYYPTRLLLQRGVDVLALKTDYTRPAFNAASRQEQANWMATDARTAALASRLQRPEAKIILVGKSIGSLALAHLVANEGLASAATLWLTPLLHYSDVVQAAMQLKGPAFFVASSADRTFDPEAMAKIQDWIGARSLILEGANHSLEIPGDVFQSMRMMSQIMQAIARFLEGVL